MTAIARSGRLETSTAAGGDAAPIDLVHLARQTFGSVELEHEVLALFVAQSRGLVATIAGEAGAERVAALHRLKGSARGVGARRIADLAEALEAPDLAEGDAGRLIEALIAAEAETRRFVARLTGRSATAVDDGRGPSAT